MDKDIEIRIEELKYGEPEWLRILKNILEKKKQIRKEKAIDTEESISDSKLIKFESLQ